MELGLEGGFQIGENEMVAGLFVFLNHTTSSYGKKVLASDMNVDPPGEPNLAQAWGTACQNPRGPSTLPQCAVPEFMPKPL